MLYGAKTIAKYLLGTDRADRNFAVFPDDTMIVSYPRSGNTWMRFLVAHLLHPDLAISFANIETLIPDTAAISSRALKRVPRPRTIKSHEYFDHRYPKTIYIVRDPRDVVLSFYDFQRKYGQIEDSFPLEMYVNDFVLGRLNSASWGTWAENVGSWTSSRYGSHRFLLVRFEDMLSDTKLQLARVADFIGVATSSAMLDRAVMHSSAGRMRKLEKQQEHQWTATQNHRKDIPFVRTAKAGGWKNQLPRESAVQIEQAWTPLMVSLGYPVDSCRREAIQHPFGISYSISL